MMNIARWGGEIPLLSPPIAILPISGLQYNYTILCMLLPKTQSRQALEDFYRGPKYKRGRLQFPDDTGDSRSRDYNRDYCVFHLFLAAFPGMGRIFCQECAGSPDGSSRKCPCAKLPVRIQVFVQDTSEEQLLSDIRDRYCAGHPHSGHDDAFHAGSARYRAGEPSYMGFSAWSCPATDCEHGDLQIRQIS